jgi:hypothetical protein
MKTSFEDQISAAVFKDCVTTGTGIYKTACRKWYNPMRWIKGLIYFKRIKPTDFI